MNEINVYNTLVVVQIVSAVLIFIILFKITAPYGRHGTGRWGPSLPARAGWMLMEFPAVMVIALCFVAGNRSADPVSLVFLLIWEVHYIQRTFIFPLLMKTGKGFPVILIFFAMTFNIMNGYINGRYLFYFAAPYGIGWLMDPRFIAGFAVFVSGYIINVHSDHILRNLRKPGETGYKIPSGGMFRFVSSPNYFGEILEWTGWAILTWSLPGFAFAVFTFANLVPRAYANHRWYKQNFPEYPIRRRAVIPFIY